mmetsp:Transcript_6434/g.17283  ORF Transcript_6434/g.17283 Transcript_6434/m.17283 type:complete len:391 (-) Transcript_6434:154-1326(-)
MPASAVRILTSMRSRLLYASVPCVSLRLRSCASDRLFTMDRSASFRPRKLVSSRSSRAFVSSASDARRVKSPNRTDSSSMDFIFPRKPSSSAAILSSSSSILSSSCCRCARSPARRSLVCSALATCVCLYASSCSSSLNRVWLGRFPLSERCRAVRSMAATMATRLASASFNALALDGSKFSMYSVSSRSCLSNFSNLSARSMASTEAPPSRSVRSFLAPASFDSPAWIARCSSTISASARAVSSLCVRIFSLSRSRCVSGGSDVASFSSRSLDRVSVKSRSLSRSASARCLTWSPPSARSVVCSSAVARSMSASTDFSFAASRSFSASSDSYSRRLAPGSSSTRRRMSICSRSSCASASFRPLSRVTRRSNASSRARRSSAFLAASAAR